MLAKNLLKIIILTLCLLIPFQARAAVLMDYTVYVEGVEETSGSLSSDGSNSATEFTVNKGQFFHIKTSCRLDVDSQSNNHADDFKIGWLASFGTDFTSWEGEINGVLYSHALIRFPFDDSDDVYASIGVGGTFSMWSACTYGGSSLTKQFTITLAESKLVVAATPETLEVEEGGSEIISVEFYGDVEPCTATGAVIESDSALPESYVDCSGVLSYAIQPTTGLTITQNRIIRTGFGSRAKYNASYTVQGDASGNYSVEFSVEGDGYWGQEASAVVAVAVTEPEPEPEPEVAVDADGDGYDNTADCDDADPAVHPGAEEICNGEDDDCDGAKDEDIPTNTYYLDADGDGYGTSPVSISLCSQPAGYVTDSTDCNDSTPLAYPGRAEICDDTLDNDCDGTADSSSICAVSGTDADGDGYTVDVDCDDGNASINPGVSDDCTNQIDMNCDNVVSNCGVISPQIDGTTIQETGVAGQVSGGADVGGCGCVVMGNVNPNQLSMFVIFAMSLLGGGMFRFFRKR